MAKATDYENDGRKYQVGEVLETDQGNMHVHAVSYQERPGQEEGTVERHNFSYTLRHEDDVKAEQKAAAEAEKAAKEQADAAAAAPAK